MQDMSPNLPPDLTQSAATVAAATRLLVMEQLLDYSGHISLRIADRNAFLIQTGMDSRAELAPENLLLVDYNGKVLAGQGKPPAELAIHTEILKARPDVQSILHCHIELAITFTLMQGVALAPMRARAVRWESGIPTHPDPSHIKLKEQGQALAKTLGAHNAALVRAHGLVLVAESAPAILVDAVHFAENARAHLLALQSGHPPLPLTPAELEQINKHEMRDFHVAKLWNYYTKLAIANGVIPPEWNTRSP